MSAPQLPLQCTAFAGTSHIATGSPQEVATTLWEWQQRGDERLLLTFDDESARPVEFELQGSLEDVLARIEKRLPDESASEEEEGEPVQTRGRGRPKLGVVPREVTLLPRHWDWLGEQRGGASATLRRLVETARKTETPRLRKRRAQEAADRFMGSIAGDRAGYEAATRALYAGNREGFEGALQDWPEDVRVYATKLAEGAW